MRIPSAATVSSKKTVRSSGLPSSSACAPLPYEKPSHIVGVRDPRKKNQIRGTHSAGEGLRVPRPVEPEKSHEENKPEQ